MTKGLFRRNLEIFKYLLSVGLWEYNCEPDRTLYSGPSPTPLSMPARGRPHLGRVGEESFTGTNKDSGAGVSQIGLPVPKSAHLSV